MTKRLYINSSETPVILKEGEDLLSAIRNSAAGSKLESPCNGKGYCGKCKIRIRSGNVSSISSRELKYLTPTEQSDCIRLACYTHVLPETETIHIETLYGTTSSFVLDSFHLPDYKLNPLMIKSYDRLRNETLIQCQGKLIGTEVSDTVDQLYGIAIDIGTTTIAACLINLNNSSLLAKASAVNPQTVIGGDVLSRIEYVQNNSKGLDHLQELLISCINELTLQMLDQAEIPKDAIYCYSIAANTTMLHLLLHTDPISLALAPYTPVFTEEQLVLAHKLGLTNCSESALVYCLPSVSAYIGADIVAGVFISGISKTDKNIIFIDIGTNGEMVLSQRGTMTSCSCAVGPALEGMNITHGMRASQGAIEHVILSDHGITVETIDHIAPAGICGSGVLETTAALLKGKAIEKSGRLAKQIPDALASNALNEDGSLSYQLAKGPVGPITFNQQDVRQVQLAKGALLSGFVSLLQTKGLTFDDVDQVIIAGQFGSYLKEEILIDTGILPEQVRGHVSYIGNSSLSGAVLCLLDREAAEQMSTLAKQIEYYELALAPGYTKLLMKCLAFPEPSKE